MKSKFLSFLTSSVGTLKVEHSKLCLNGFFVQKLGDPMKKILVVDNHPVMLTFMSNLLEKEGHQVSTAEDGLSALEILESFVPDVAFIDLVMPNIDGRKLCRMIRGMQNMKDVCLVFISGIAADVNIDFSSFGADGCIAKGPFNKLREHVLSTLDILEKGSAADLSKNIIGLEDVCERITTKELLSAKKHSERIFDSMEEGIIELTSEWKVVYVNPAGLSIIGIPGEILLGSVFIELFNEIQAAIIKPLLESTGEFRLSIPEESSLSINNKVVSLEILHINEENRESVVVIINDITKRKQAEKTLLESEEQYRTLFETSKDAIMTLVPPDWKFASGNLATINMFMAKDEQDFISKNPWELSSEYQPDGQLSTDKATKMIDKAVVEGSNFFEWTHKRLNGDEFPATVLLSRIELEKTQLLQATVRDITDRKRAEEEKMEVEKKLQQAQKMSSIATLAGGIAHQFNNALAAVIGNTELLQLDLPGNKLIEEYVGPIMNSTERMTNLTGQLLAYSRGGRYKMRVLPVNDFVRDTVPLIIHTVDQSVNVSTDLSDDILYIEADLTQLQMVLSSVLSNASEAIGSDGHIQIAVKRFNVDDDFVTSHPEFEKRTYVCLIVEDDGAGMDEETLKRIFEPFYTTKFLGRGLGMAAVYGIVRSHGGSILIESELSKGTRVHIYMPLVEALINETIESEKGPSVSSETVLLIEDEKIVMDVNQMLLERLGYRVLGAKTGEEAINIVNTFEGDIDIAILDIVLPDMDGGVLYPLLSKALPNLKVIVCSGYSIDGPAQDILDAGAQAFIQKPFTFEKLSEKLDEILK